jgi:hypothetical protein
MDITRGRLAVVVGVPLATVSLLALIGPTERWRDPSILLMVGCGLVLVLVGTVLFSCPWGERIGGWIDPQ